MAMRDDEPSPDLDLEVNPGWVVESAERGAENEATLGRLRSIFGPGNGWMTEGELVRAMGVTRDEFLRLDCHRWLEHDGLGHYRLNAELLGEG